ncbi:hypothetical protein C8Q73DRAFT_100409 [Cubamyces lactineus]|nr:hypothetical protein C8Q73DRAFT_100409 [Cubamyces lactineus]
MRRSLRCTNAGLAASTVSARTDEDLSREQQLEAEVAELRSALKVAEVDLASARSHVQRFQEISQANEAALATLNSTHDEYRVATEAELTKRQSEIEAYRRSFVQPKNASLNFLKQTLSFSRGSTASASRGSMTRRPLRIRLST